MPYLSEFDEKISIVDSDFFYMSEPGRSGREEIKVKLSSLKSSIDSHLGTAAQLDTGKTGADIPTNSIRWEIETVTDADRTITADDVSKFNFSTSATNRTATLPAATGTGRRILIRKIDTGAGKVLIDPDGTDKITFRASLEQVTLTSQGDYWVLEDAASGFWELVDGVESGDDGEVYWKRKADGQMDQWLPNTEYTDQAIDDDYADSGLYSGTRLYSLPRTYLSEPTSGCSKFRWRTGGSWGTVGAVSVDSINVRGIDIVSRPTGETVEISWETRGRWYA